MSSILSQSFKKMIDENLKENTLLQLGCKEKEINLLKERCLSKLNMSLPQEYINFLRELNGYSDYGMMLYASEEIYLKESDSWIYGVIENNYHYFRLFPEVLVIGECGDDLLIYDITSKLYKNIDRVGSYTSGEFKSFWAMVEDCVEPLVCDNEDDD